MPLNEPQLAQGILQLLTDMRTKEQNSDSEFSNRLAKLICNCIKTGTVTVQPGILVSTTGSATAQTGTTTANGTGTIS